MEDEEANSQVEDSDHPKVGLDDWLDEIRRLIKEHHIHVGEKPDDTAARRIANLIGDSYLTLFGKKAKMALCYPPILEKTVYDIAIELHLLCDPLEREKRARPEYRRRVLSTWGVNKISGREGDNTNLKEEIKTLLLDALESTDKEVFDAEHGEDESGRTFDLGGGSIEAFGAEEIGVG